ncbi:hypothetical protein MMC28_008486 [Mycoblastus sanguinarius]|nr:hypothetical protein [Mycoblastus sanguinarius]
MSTGLEEIFLDFLYPLKTAALIRQLRRSTNAHHQAAQSLKQCSRAYTSIAADLVTGAEQVGVKNQGQIQGASARESSPRAQAGKTIRKAINELLDLEDHTGIYDELWQSYQDLLEVPQSLSPQMLIRMLRCLATAERTVDVERSIALFESIPIEGRRAIHYSHAVSAALTLKDLDIAVAIHREALSRMNSSVGTSAILRYAVQQGLWPAAIGTWHEFWDQKLVYFTRPDIWSGVDALPLADLIEKASSAADFAISLTESTGYNSALVAREFALELIRHTFTIQGIEFDCVTHWHLIEKARMLDTSEMKTSELALQQLLSVRSPERTSQALRLYRGLRNETMFPFSQDLLRTITHSLLSANNASGLLTVLDDWRKWFQTVPPDLIVNIASNLARRGELEAVRNLFNEYLANFGTPRSESLFHSLLKVYNRRADTKGVVQTFEDIQTNQAFKPTIQAWNFVISTFSRVGDVDGALSWFNKLRETKTKPDSHTYFTLMAMYGKRGDRDAVDELFQQSKVEGVEIIEGMIDSLVLVNIKDERFEEAEKLIDEASKMEIKGSRTFMWNILLNAYALRKELGKVSELHKRMQEVGVIPDSMTYAALLTSLAVAKQPDPARKLMHKVMPRFNIKRTALHYAIVMGGYLATQEYGKIFRLYKEMLRRNISPNMSTQNVFLRAAASVDIEKMDADKSSGNQIELPRAQEALEQIITSLDPKELADNEPRKFVGPELLNEAFSSTYFEYLIFLYGKASAFNRVSELYEQHIATAAKFSITEDIEASPPMRMLAALMVAHKHADNHAEVDSCWYLCLEKCKQLACRSKADTSEPGWVLHSRRFILNIPLKQYINALGEQRRTAELIATIDSVRQAGYDLNSPNWNLYVQWLARAQSHTHQALAFEICEKELIADWPGWDNLGGSWAIQMKTNAMFRYTLLLPHQRLPAYPTFVRLAAAYSNARSSKGRKSSMYVAALAKAAPRTVDAIHNMPRLEDELQNTILRQD